MFDRKAHAKGCQWMLKSRWAAFDAAADSLSSKNSKLRAAAADIASSPRDGLCRERRTTFAMLS
jgi:hypothetical protein